MDKNAIAEQIKAYLVQKNTRSGALLKHDTLLLEEWFIDSMGIVTLVLFLEKQFGIRMGPADISAANFRTLDALSTFVAAKSASH
jgi:acyl carrier protein